MRVFFISEMILSSALTFSASGTSGISSHDPTPSGRQLGLFLCYEPGVTRK